MGWAPCQEARATLPTLTIPVMEEEEEEQKDNRINIDNELPEGMTDREIDSLFNEWAVRNFISEEECDPKNVNPDSPVCPWSWRCPLTPWCASTSTAMPPGCAAP